eukprot:TRINITY_DN16209_c0_g4_i1.p3 TRINITY_DN16209_c0_g4~~TRINITY_DN16209_c0_g4_i1.p3  ORF type:complete len:189 (-),score=19.05 TRINITY_DN16209_c0_g4_i1:122-688(-)
MPTTQTIIPINSRRVKGSRRMAFHSAMNMVEVDDNTKVCITKVFSAEQYIKHTYTTCSIDNTSTDTISLHISEKKSCTLCIQSVIIKGKVITSMIMYRHIIFKYMDCSLSLRKEGRLRVAASKENERRMSPHTAVSVVLKGAENLEGGDCGSRGEGGQTGEFLKKGREDVLPQHGELPIVLHYRTHIL